GPRCLDQSGKPGQMVGLDVCLEDRDDRRSGTRRLLEIAVDELLVRVDDREPRLRQTAEQVARAGRLREEEGAKNHVLARNHAASQSARRVLPYVLSVLPMDRSTTLRELWDTTRLRLLVEIERRGRVPAA